MWVFLRASLLMHHIEGSVFSFTARAVAELFFSSVRISWKPYMTAFLKQPVWLLAKDRQT